MWLLSFHFGFSVLCLLTFIGFTKLFREVLIQNGWVKETKKKKYSFLVFFFVPLMNVVLVLCLFMMIVVKEEEFAKTRQEAKKESED